MIKQKYVINDIKNQMFMNEYFTSFFDSMKTRIRNPFLGTLTIVWAIRNWKVIYALFNFDDGYTLTNKINFIQNYFNQKSFFWEVTLNLIITLIVLLSTYVLLALSKSIVEFYYKVIEKYIIQLIDKKSIIDKNQYLMLFNQTESYLEANEKKDRKILNIESINSENQKIIEITRKENKDLFETIKRYSDENEIYKENILNLNSQKDLIIKDNIKTNTELNEIKHKYIDLNYQLKFYIDNIDSHKNTDILQNINVDLINSIENFKIENSNKSKKMSIQDIFHDIYNNFSKDDIKQFLDFKNNRVKRRSDFNIKSYVKMLVNDIIIEDMTGKIELGSIGIRFINFIEKMIDLNLNIKR